VGISGDGPSDGRACTGDDVKCRGVCGGASRSTWLGSVRVRRGARGRQRSQARVVEDGTRAPVPCLLSTRTTFALIRRD
jgi:hypothetical protein